MLIILFSHTLQQVMLPTINLLINLMNAIANPILHHSKDLILNEQFVPAASDCVPDDEQLDDSSNTLPPSSIFDTTLASLQAGCGPTNSGISNNVLKRGRSCPVTSTSKIVEFPPWLKAELESSERLPKRIPKWFDHRDEKCDKYTGRPDHVTCGGFEVEPNFEFIPFVMNCRAGKF